MHHIYNQNIQILHHMFMKYYIMILMHQGSADTGMVTDFLFTNVTIGLEIDAVHI